MESDGVQAWKNKLIYKKEVKISYFCFLLGSNYWYKHEIKFFSCCLYLIFYEMPQ